MDDNRHTYNDGYYEDSEKKRNPLITIIKWILIIIILIIIILLLLKKCGKAPNYEDLLTAGKKYFTQENGAMPVNKGECNTVTLEQLQNKGLIGSNYRACDKNATSVKVCILPSGSRQYTPVLSCENEKTVFDDYKEGYESNLTKDSSDVRFTYQATIGGIKMYYPTDSSDPSTINEYYTTSPKEGYIFKDEGTNVYNYYKPVTTKKYYNNGTLYANQPAGYPYSEGKTSKTIYTDTKPSGNYTQITLYRTFTKAHVVRYACSLGGGNIKYQLTPCENINDSLIDKFEYGCDGESGSPSNFGKICSTSDWTETKCEVKDANSITGGGGCESKTSYKYTENYYKWYKNETTNYYYPSNKTTATDENTYYAASPQDGYVRDDNSKATGYKYYKLVDEEGKIITDDNGLSITNGYVTLQELIKACQDRGYNVNSLEDIEKINDLSYDIKLEYRNRV